MTDNEIIKALKCCGDEDVHFCSICPTYLHDKDNDFCQEDLHRMSLDLINRQKAEIERLIDKVNRLKESVRLMLNCDDGDERIKSQARKEFAERLKKNLHEYSDSVFTIVTVFREINNLLKEMESESNEG